MIWIDSEEVDKYDNLLMLFVSDSYSSKHRIKEVKRALQAVHINIQFVLLDAFDNTDLILDYRIKNIPALRLKLRNKVYVLQFNEIVDRLVSLSDIVNNYTKDSAKNSSS